MKLPVPYYSQFIDIQDPFWMLRACGGISLKMVAEYHLSVGTPNKDGVKDIDIIKLCNEAKERGGYDMQNGWVHDYIVTKAQELGLQAHRSERITPITDEIISSLEAGNPVIVSVEKRVLEQTRFHIIVIVGYERNAEKSGTNADHHGINQEEFIPNLADSYKLQPTSFFYYHEPESTDKERGQYRMCDVETFKNYWRGKAIFISK